MTARAHRWPTAHRATRSDRGYVIVLIATAITVLLLITAIVIDLSFLRNDRRADQKVVDAAAAAGAVTLATPIGGLDGKLACESAVDSIVRNLPEISSTDDIDGLDCSEIPSFCDVDTPLTLSSSTTGTSGPYTITVVHPVVDSDPLMTSGSAIGQPALDHEATEADGDECHRVGVELALERAPTFGNVVDSSPRTTSVHAVALASSAKGPPLPINLLILERTSCDAIRVEGSGFLNIDPIMFNGEQLPGVLAVESDGTGAGCTGTSPRVGTLNVVSANVRSNGPRCGPPKEVGSIVDPVTGLEVGLGCGDITLFAPGVPGASDPGSCKSEKYVPACTTNNSGSLFPSPERMGFRHTRAAFDHIYNCKATYDDQWWYTNGDQPISGCFGATTDLDYVDEVRDFVEQGIATSASGTPPGFTRYGDNAGECDVAGGGGAVVIPEGNIHVVCETLFVKKGLTFEGGNVIFDGDVVIEAANGHLTVNACGAETAAITCNPADPLVTEQPLDPSAPWWQDGDNYDEPEYSEDAAWVVFRNGGTIRKAGGASLTIHDSVVFLGKDAEYSASARALDLEGGSGSLTWTAPREGPFENLSLWTDSEIRHHFAGQAGLGLEGIFFAPMGLITYAGSGSQDQIAAQFVTERLLVTGSGEVRIAPNTDRAGKHKVARSTLIR